MDEEPFVPPNNFDEFYQQNPQWVRWFACRVLRKHQYDDAVLDLEQDLLGFLSTLPPTSKFRDDGHTDRISTFDVKKCGGHKASGLFYNWLVTLCKRYYYTWYVSRQRDVATSNRFSPVGIGTDHKKLLYDPPIITRLYLNQFRSAVADQDHRLLPFMDALIAHGGNVSDASASLGYTRSQDAAARRSIKTAAKRFAAGKPLRRKNGRHPSIDLDPVGKDGK